MRYLLDTHTWLWWSISPELLSEQASALTAPEGVDNELLLSVISVWEVATMIRKGRLTLAESVEDWIEKALSMPRLRLVGISTKIAVAANQLPGEFHADSADQIIVATARIENARLLTKDERIQAYVHVNTIW